MTVTNLKSFPLSGTVGVTADLDGVAYEYRFRYFKKARSHGWYVAATDARASVEAAEALSAASASAYSASCV